MATATTTTKNSANTDVPEFAQKIREQLVTTVRQGQQLSLEAAQAWVKAVSVLPSPDLPKVPGVPTVSNVQAVNKFTFDVAADLLNAQRDFATQLASVLAPSAQSSA